MSPAGARAAPPTARELLGRAREHLASRRVPEPEANAEFLLAAVLGKGRAALKADPRRLLSPEQGRAFWRLVLERGRRVPLAYVLGTQQFLGLELKVGPGVLIPRPETEELVEAAAALARGPGAGARPLFALDIGTGSGCIALALAKLLPSASVWATDISTEALALARENARRLGLAGRVRFVPADLHRPMPSPLPGAAGWADLIVSNPPYIPSGRLVRLEPELGHEPRLALDGGPDGLGAVRAILGQAPRHLRAGGWLALEIDEGQGEAVRSLMRGAGLESVEIRRDLAGLERIALGRAAG